MSDTNTVRAVKAAVDDAAEWDVARALHDVGFARFDELRYLVVCRRCGAILHTRKIRTETVQGVEAGRSGCATCLGPLEVVDLDNHQS